EVNVTGTVNLLEEIRRAPTPPSLIYTSTNKVYGSLDRVSIQLREKRYVAINGHSKGIDESMPLDFHSPYGCSKGAAEQYVLDYHRTFGLRTAVFRMSCIYGPHQFGTEDEGWVAYIMSRVIARQPIRIYGNGRQVRDILFIDDLVDALLLARDRVNDVAGQAFNIGGGPHNAISLLEFLDLLKELNERPAFSFSPWRVGDQKYFVSDT